MIVVHDEDRDVAVLEHDQDDAVSTTNNDIEEPPPYTVQDNYIMADEPENYYDASQLLLTEGKGEKVFNFVCKT